MSSQPIPTVAQIAAARSLLWHQSSSLELDASASAQSPRPSSDDSAETETGETRQAMAAEAAEIEDGTVEAAEHPQVPEPITRADEQLVADVEPAMAGPAPPPASRSAAILTQGEAREFLNRAGLMLFAARPQFAGVPAPTFVEATLGTANANPSLSAAETARTLLAHLVSDGSAVPLNLLGLPTTTAEAPDFVASAAAFPYIFTLRGDKAWKQPPATSGSAKVSPLAANTYTLLVENGPKSAYALTGDLGKEVTEAAVLRALSELWQQLRILPVPQGGGKATLWEPITTRFTKAIKTGANAGQPTALSTFVSLFLNQALLATEEEVETFLSPLAPRSRVRDVLHALSGARELETMTIEGRHHVHLAGDLPMFRSAEPATTGPTGRVEVAVLAEDGSRIKKFVPKPSKLGTGFGDRPKSFRAPGDRGRSEGRPVRQPSAKRFGADAVRSAFDKPWDEEKQARSARTEKREEVPVPEFQDLDLDASGASSSGPTRRVSSPGTAPFARKPGFSGKPGFAARPRAGGDRPAFSRDRPSGGDRPTFSRAAAPPDRRSLQRDRPGSDRSASTGASDPRPPRREFTPRPGDSDGRPPRKSFSAKPSFSRGSGDAGRAAGDRERRPFRREDDAAGGSRPPRRSFEEAPRGDRSREATLGDRAPRSNGMGQARPSFASRSPLSRESESGSGRPPFRRFDAPRTPRAPREGGDSRPPRRSNADGDRPPFRREGDAGRGGAAAKRPFVRRDASSATGGDARRQGFAPREGGGAPRGGGGFAPRREGGAPTRSGGSTERSEGTGFSQRREGTSGTSSSPGRPAGTGKPFAKRPTRSAPDAPGAGTFEKFKGGNKPWGKRPPARKYKPKGDGV